MRSKLTRLGAPGVLGILAVAALGACSGDDEGDQNLAPDPNAADSVQPGDATTPAEGTTGSDPSSCDDVEPPAARADGGAAAPTDSLDPAETWTLTFDTSCGTFVVTLDLQSAPATAASLVALAEEGFFDDTVFHRIVPGFVIQGGDPTQTGGGGPGYKTVDAPASDAAYTRGLVAMAKTGQEPAGTSGSQFFVVTGADVGLPPDYAVVGEVTEGLDVVERIGTLGDPATEQPTQPVLIRSVTAASTSTSP